MDNSLGRNAQTYMKNSDCSCSDFSGRCFRKQQMSIKSFLMANKTHKVHWSIATYNNQTNAYGNLGIWIMTIYPVSPKKWRPNINCHNYDFHVFGLPYSFQYLSFIKVVSPKHYQPKTKSKAKSNTAGEEIMKCSSLSLYLYLHISISLSIYIYLSLSVLTAIFPGESGSACFIVAKDNGGGGDNWS